MRRETLFHWLYLLSGQPLKLGFVYSRWLFDYNHSNLTPLLLSIKLPWLLPLNICSVLYFKFEIDETYIDKQSSYHNNCREKLALVRED